VGFCAGDGLAVVEQVFGLGRIEACLPPHVPVPKKGPCPGSKKAASTVSKIAKKAVAKPKAKPKAAAPQPGKDKAPDGGGDFAQRFKQAEDSWQDARNAATISGAQSLQGRDKVGGMPVGKIRDGLDNYKGDFFDDINGGLRRSGGKPLRGERGADVKAISAAMSESTLDSDVAVYRGIEDAQRLFGAAWPGDGDATGLEWEDPAFTSTTTSRRVADSFISFGGGRGKPVLMRILVPKGTHAIGMNGFAFGNDPEYELLLDRGLRFRVAGDRRENGQRILDVEVIPRG
jgi:hypothetical protein